MPITSMTDQDRRISEIVAQERSRLRNFIRKRVPDPAEVEDILQEVFYRLVEANQRVASNSGVNLDEELTALQTYQQAYAAGARIMTVVDQLYQTLLQIQ